MAAVVAAAGDTAGRVALMIVGLGGALWVVRRSIGSWRGEEFRWIAAQEAQEGRPYPMFRGSSRKYQTLFGANYLFAVNFAGLVIITAGDLLRMALGRGEDWGPWWAASIAGVTMWVVWGGLMAAYITVGLPDRLRPPCQRGWEVVDGELKLVRPGRTREEYEARKPLWAQPGDDAWADHRWGPRSEHDR